MAQKPRRTPQHPVVSGQEYTFARLSALTGLSAANVAQKYHRVLAAHGTVTLAQLTTPFVRPDVQQRRDAGLLQREIDTIVRHARMHGPTHAAMRFKLEPSDVATMLRNANNQAASKLAQSPLLRQSDT